MTVSFVVQKLWSLIRSHLSILASVANAFGVLRDLLGFTFFSSSFFCAVV